MSNLKLYQTIIATKLAQAVLKDEAPNEGGFDLSAGIFGTNVSNFIREIAKDFEAQNETKSPDSNVEKNREMLLQRSIVGLAKYGVTTDNNPLSLRAWLQHALEEALDMANYLQAAITKIDESEK
jgi:hypothetical protein